MSWDWVGPLGGVIGATSGLIGGSAGIWGGYRARATDNRVKEIDARAQERSDVAWACDWISDRPEEPIWRIKNIGADTAHNVEIVLHANDPTHERPRRVKVARADPGAGIDFDLAQEWAAERVRYDQDFESGTEDPQFLHIPPTTRVTVTARILWTSELGTPHQQEHPQSNSS
ncbi:hypothetical protein J2W54_004962 [Rhodococcus fascians]|uniref:hypothetical protein n=1 Tax=Nocardiaceae TaxID=85025 RepID=UPI0028542590|nr:MULTISPECIES: hypothetical protein [Rhodococcus]MDR6912949.1 hypothetical protein [Rhodococcus sp. 3258]MDR6934546.1 hypothetical protein [Rhodococcus fascians]